jgi:hypothetical protein
MAKFLLWQSARGINAFNEAHCPRNHHCDRETGGPVEEFWESSWRLIRLIFHSISTPAILITDKVLWTVQGFVAACFCTYAP